MIQETLPVTGETLPGSKGSRRPAPIRRTWFDRVRGWFFFNRSIVISYRVSDSEEFSGRIYDRLARVFGRAVVRDAETLKPGCNFASELRRHIERCRVFIPVIGPDWVGKCENDSRRIDDPEDLVRKELEWALEQP